MSVVQCLACQHESPATAKFCSECGGQLNLKLCKQCEAINERAWQRCHNCGAKFPAEPMASDLRAAESPLLDVQVARPPAAHRKRTSQILVGVLAFGTMAGLVFYLYSQPNLNRNEVHVGRLPAASVTRVDAGAAPVDISTAKTQATRVKRANDVAKPSRAETLNDKQSAGATAGDSAVRSSPELPATIASDAPKVQNAPARTAAAAGDTPRAKPTKRLAAEPNDFHLIAPPP